MLGTISPFYRRLKLAVGLGWSIGVPVSVVIGVVLLVAYLGQIDRTDLLLRVVASEGGLILLTVWAMTLVLVLIGMFFGSILSVDAAITLYSSPQRVVPRMMPWVLVGCDVLWCTIFVFAMRLGIDTVCFGISVGVLALLVVSVAAVIECRTMPDASARKEAAVRGLLVGASFWLAAILSSFGSLALLVVVPSFGHKAATWLVAILTLLPCIPGLVMGLLLFFGYRKDREVTRGRRQMIIAVLCLSAVGLVSAFNPIDRIVLQSLGVYSSRPARFVPATPTVASDLCAAGFGGLCGTSRNGVFQAVVQFRFGEVLILCRPEASSLSDVPPVTTSGHAPKQQQRRTASCIDLRADDVRLLARNTST